MKKLILMFVLLGLVGCAKTLEEKREDHKVCAEKVIKQFNQKYKDMGERGQVQLFNDMCKFNGVPSDNCMQAILMTHMQGQLQNALDGFAYHTAIVPECGEYPKDEDKKSKDK